MIDDRSDELTCTEIVSRHQVPHEYVLLTKMVNALHPQLRRQVVGVICDSKQTHSYGIQLSRWNQKSAEMIALMIKSVAIHHCGGTNGIIVNCRGNQFYLEAIWDEERLADWGRVMMRAPNNINANAVREEAAGLLQAGHQ